MDSDKLMAGFLSVVRDLFLAFIVVLIVLGALMAYCRVWPPVVVVESGSMMHDAESHIGVIDTGDMVLVRKVNDRSDIVTYPEGEATNYRTYGSYGNVIVFNPNGDLNSTPIIHRAILWIEANDTLCVDEKDYAHYTFDVPAYGLYGFYGNLTIENYGQSFSHLPENASVFTPPEVIRINFEGIRRIYENHDVVPFNGFLTRGDHNPPGIDQDSRYLPVKMDWVVGKAAGELPWFGLIKLTVTGDLPSEVPSNSWVFLFVSGFLLISVPLFIEFGLPMILKLLKKGKEDEDDGTDEEMEVKNDEKVDSLDDEKTNRKEDGLEIEKQPVEEVGEKDDKNEEPVTEKQPEEDNINSQEVVDPDIPVRSEQAKEE